MVSLCSAADALGIHVVSSASLAQGRLKSGLPDWLGTLFRGSSSDVQRALQFVRSTPGVAIALVGMRQVKHVEENIGTARIPPAPVEDFPSSSRSPRRPREAKILSFENMGLRHANAECALDHGFFPSFGHKPWPW
jgi:hypothetical protein